MSTFDDWVRAPALDTVDGMDDKMLGETPPAVLWFSRGDRILLIAGAMLMGGLLGFAVPYVAEWGASLTWIPFQGPLELIASWSQWWVRYVCIAVGVLLGLALVAAAFYDTARVAVSEAHVRITEKGETATVSRSQVGTVFVDGKELVLLDAASRQLVRVPSEEKREAIEAAFEQRGYSVAPGDPYADLYHLWVPETPGLAPEVNAVLKARDMALKKKAGSDARELRSELDRLGVVVRDKKTSQYWRPLVRS
ncbi:YqeB family protein [Rhodococcus sp. IEGM1428]|uniref:YqeB family protein n=1 Tax=Rhodococcus sp. IEGM1428 TaxID=3392191 RepID=UPI003D0C0B85